MARNIVITGAGKGLGRAIARRLAADGETLILLGRTLSKVEAVAAELGNGSYALECDISSPESVRAAFAAIKERSGKVDVLINNAAVYQPYSVAEVPDDEIATSLATNLGGVMYCCRDVLPLLERGGQIINISSESVAVPFAMLTFYQASKAGMERYTQALHDEVAGDGIRVTLLRAGQMMDEDSTWNVDPDRARRFFEGNMKRGINQRERPLSHFNSVAEVFHSIVNLPADVNISHLNLEGWRN
ncbi:MAG TPA: SDR family oxidoreductase [Sphingobium sp.]